jgi:hypothetical protein
MVREAHLKLAQMHEALGQQAEGAAHSASARWPASSDVGTQCPPQGPAEPSGSQACP